MELHVNGRGDPLHAEQRIVKVLRPWKGLPLLRRCASCHTGALRLCVRVQAPLPRHDCVGDGLVACPVSSHPSRRADEVGVETVDERGVPVRSEDAQLRMGGGALLRAPSTEMDCRKLSEAALPPWYRKLSVTR